MPVDGQRQVVGTGPGAGDPPGEQRGQLAAQVDVGELGRRVERRRRARAVDGGERAHRPPDEVLALADGVEAGTGGARAELGDLARHRGAHARLELGGVDAQLRP